MPKNYNIDTLCAAGNERNIFNLVSTYPLREKKTLHHKKLLQFLYVTTDKEIRRKKENTPELNLPFT